MLCEFGAARGPLLRRWHPRDRRGRQRAAAVAAAIATATVAAAAITASFSTAGGPARSPLRFLPRRARKGLWRDLRPGLPILSHEDRVVRMRGCGLHLR